MTLARQGPEPVQLKHRFSFPRGQRVDAFNLLVTGDMQAKSGKDEASGKHEWITGSCVKRH